MWHGLKVQGEWQYSKLPFPGRDSDLQAKTKKELFQLMDLADLEEKKQARLNKETN